MGLIDLNTRLPVVWRDAIEKHCHSLKPGTVKKWWQLITEVESVTGKELPQVTTLDAQNYRAAQSLRKGYKCRRASAGGGLTPSTIATKLHSIHSIFELLRAHGIITSNPFDVVMRAKEIHNARIGEFNGAIEVQPEHAKKLLFYPWRETKQDIRDAATLAILFGCGLRASGVCGLRLCDVQRGPDGALYLDVTENKGNGSYCAAMPEWAEQRVYNLYQQRLKEGATGSDPLIVNYGAGGKPSSHGTGYQTLRKRFEKWLRDAGIYERYTLHCCRATWATRLLDQGCTNRQVQDAGGWKSEKMPQLYNKRHFKGKDSVAKKITY